MDRDRKEDKVILYETHPRLEPGEDHKKNKFTPYDEAEKMIDHDDEKKK